MTEEDMKKVVKNISHLSKTAIFVCIVIHRGSMKRDKSQRLFHMIITIMSIEKIDLIKKC